MLLEVEALVLFMCVLHSQPRDWLRTWRGDCQLRPCQPAIPKLSGMTLKHVGWKGKVRSSNYTSIPLKQCSVDLRKNRKGMNLADFLVIVFYFLKKIIKKQYPEHG